MQSWKAHLRSAIGLTAVLTLIIAGIGAVAAISVAAVEAKNGFYLAAIPLVAVCVIFLVSAVTDWGTAP